MYAIKSIGSAIYYEIKMDSYGYTVKSTTDRNHATVFDTRAEAMDVWNDLDEYWHETSKVVSL